METLQRLFEVWEDYYLLPTRWGTQLNGNLWPLSNFCFWLFQLPTRWGTQLNGNIDRPRFLSPLDGTAPHSLGNPKELLIHNLELIIQNPPSLGNPIKYTSRGKIPIGLSSFLCPGDAPEFRQHKPAPPLQKERFIGFSGELERN